MNTNVGIQYYKMHDWAVTPSFGTLGAACFDLSFCSENYPYSPTIKINPGQTVVVGTGLIFAIPLGFHIQVYGRSGNAAKRGLMLANGVGIIDSDYTDELKIILYNSSNNIVTITHGDRIAQAMIMRDSNVNRFFETDTPPYPVGNRTGGLGSTGQ